MAKSDLSEIEVRLHAYALSAWAGDAAIYHTLLKELSMYLRAFFRRRLTNLPDEIEDLVQETLLAIHQQRHTYQAEYAFTAWAYAIARYKLIDLWRSRSVRGVNLGLEEEAEWLLFCDQEAREATRDVGKLLASLPPHYRLPLQHVKVEGLSVEEAAKLTGMSVSAIKVGIHRGIKLLAEKVKGVR